MLKNTFFYANPKQDFYDNLLFTPPLWFPEVGGTIVSSSVIQSCTSDNIFHLYKHETIVVLSILFFRRDVYSVFL